MLRIVPVVLHDHHAANHVCRHDEAVSAAGVKLAATVARTEKRGFDVNGLE
jgi:hypothetical protein